MANVRGERGLARRSGQRELIEARGWAPPARRMVAAAALLGALACAALAQSALASGPGSVHGYALKPSKTMPYTPCPPGPHTVECNIVIDPPAVKTPDGYQLPGGGPLLEGGGEGGGYDPSNLQSAYGIPTSGGTGETVALVEAYGYKEAETDLAKYREKYGLSACTKASGCFKRVNQKGEEKNYPAEGGEVEKSWTVETALDMDMVSAACPNCHITVVEATTQNPKDTAASVEEAATLGATEISNSYGYPENNEDIVPSQKRLRGISLGVQTHRPRDGVLRRLGLRRGCRRSELARHLSQCDRGGRNQPAQSGKLPRLGGERVVWQRQRLQSV